MIRNGAGRPVVVHAEEFPEIPGGYVEETVDLGGATVRMRRPTDPDSLLEVPGVVATFDRDGDAPYWPLLWPPAIAMARNIYRATWPSDVNVLEVGCGIGTASLAAAKRGWSVVASDSQADAVRLAVANAALNGLSIEGLELDWRRPADRKFGVILGCEVIYDESLHSALLRLLQRMLTPDGEAWFADHGRMHAPLFARRAEEAGFQVALVDESGRSLSDFRTAEYQLLVLKRR